MPDLTTLGEFRAAEKAIDEAAGKSIQALGRGDKEAYGTGLLTLFSRIGEGISPWWSTARDSDLRQFWPTCPYFSGALYTIIEKLVGVPFRIEPRDSDIKSHWKQAQEYEGILLEQAEFQQGWDEWFKKSLNDLFTQDNGWFSEVIGDGKKDGPIRGPAMGLAHLDAWRAVRTGNPEYPVIYTDTDGKMYRLHYTRVIYRAQLPSPIAEMYGVGLSWLSRCLSIAQTMVDVIRYKQEKLGSRPLRAILIGRGIAPDQVVAAVQVAEESANAKGFSRLSRYPVLGNPSKGDIGLDIVNLASLPDGFDYQNDITLGLYAIALAGGFPARWLWPATVEGATKADAMYQHMAGQTSGIGGVLRMVSTILGGNPAGPRSLAAKFLPPHLKMTFDFQDDDQDERHAQISSMRSMTRTQDLTATVIDIRTAREQMLGDGEIDETQFNDLELADGRLPDGSPVTLAIYTDNPYLAGITAESSPEELSIAQTRAEMDLMVANTTPQKLTAKIALACIAALQKAQKPVAVPAPTPPPVAPAPAGPDAENPSEGGATPEAAATEAQVEEAQKMRPFPGDLQSTIGGQKAPPEGHEFYGNQWTGGGGGTNAGRAISYHGTGTAAGKSIMAKGLQLPARGALGRPPAVYATDDFNTAMSYGLSGIRDEGEFVVFAVDRNRGDWQPDTKERGAYMTGQSIPPENLLGYAVYRANMETGEVELIEQQGQGNFPQRPYEEEKARKGYLYTVVISEREGQKQTEPIQPKGKPPKRWPKGKKVPISDADIERAIARWNENMPKAARGILEAKAVDPAEDERLSGELLNG